MTDLKIGFWDTEWSPALTYTWSNRPKYIPNEMHLEDARMLCYGIRFNGKKSVKVVDERGGQVEMLKELRDDLDKVDMLVSYNGQSFDTPKTNALFMRHGIAPPSPYREIDLYRQIRRVASFYSHKLDFVSERILDQKKVETGGFQLWIDVMSGDEKAWRKFHRYQRQDVNLLVDLFERVKPWLKLPHPVEEGEGRCRNCGSFDLQKRGFTPTLSGRYQRYQCQDCGKWQRSNERSSSTNIRDIT